MLKVDFQGFIVENRQTKVSCFVIVEGYEESQLKRTVYLRELFGEATYLYLFGMVGQAFRTDEVFTEVASFYLLQSIFVMHLHFPFERALTLSSNAALYGETLVILDRIEITVGLSKLHAL
jgi:hypothetical protein